MGFWKNLGLFNMATSKTPEQLYYGYTVVKNELEKEEKTITCSNCGFEFSEEHECCPNCGVSIYDE